MRERLLLILVCLCGLSGLAGGTQTPTPIDPPITLRFVTGCSYYCPSYASQEAEVLQALVVAPGRRKDSASFECETCDGPSLVRMVASVQFSSLDDAEDFAEQVAGGNVFALYPTVFTMEIIRADGSARPLPPAPLPPSVAATSSTATDIVLLGPCLDTPPPTLLSCALCGPTGLCTCEPCDASAVRSGTSGGAASTGGARRAVRQGSVKARARYAVLGDVTACGIANSSIASQSDADACAMLIAQRLHCTLAAAEAPGANGLDGWFVRSPSVGGDLSRPQSFTSLAVADCSSLLSGGGFGGSGKGNEVQAVEVERETASERAFYAALVALAAIIVLIVVCALVIWLVAFCGAPCVRSREPREAYGAVYRGPARLPEPPRPGRRHSFAETDAPYTARSRASVVDDDDLSESDGFGSPKGKGPPSELLLPRSYSSLRGKKHSGLAPLTARPGAPRTPHLNALLRGELQDEQLAALGASGPIHRNSSGGNGSGDSPLHSSSAPASPRARSPRIPPPPLTDVPLSPVFGRASPKGAPGRSKSAATLPRPPRLNPFDVGSDDMGSPSRPVVGSVPAADFFFGDDTLDSARSSAAYDAGEGKPLRKAKTAFVFRDNGGLSSAPTSRALRPYTPLASSRHGTSRPSVGGNPFASSMPDMRDYLPPDSPSYRSTHSPRTGVGADGTLLRKSLDAPQLDMAAVVRMPRPGSVSGFYAQSTAADGLSPRSLGSPRSVGGLGPGPARSGSYANPLLSPQDSVRGGPASPLASRSVATGVGRGSSGSRGAPPPRSILAGGSSLKKGVGGGDKGRRRVVSGGSVRLEGLGEREGGRIEPQVMTPVPSAGDGVVPWQVDWQVPRFEGSSEEGE